MYFYISFCPQNLSRSEPVTSGGAAARAAQAKKEKKKRMPKLEEFLQSRDYVGAMTLLDVRELLLHAVAPMLIIIVAIVTTHAHSVFFFFGRAALTFVYMYLVHS